MSCSDPPHTQDVPRAGSATGTDFHQVHENIDAVLAFYALEDQKVGRSQRLLERLSMFIGQPIFIGLIITFVIIWILANVALGYAHLHPFDPPPFSWLQGILGLSALLIATAVLARQNRLAKLAEQRAHLDLKVILLTEQKTAKLIDLLEELRRDLPNVPDRHDSQAALLQKSMSPGHVLDALNERRD
ncbi:MAG: DUF1003 domain-containing protein [Burkholderiaceae bacterium]|jgi:uncharacterized membrane protein